ncbi:MAG: cupin domain-containing protein [Gemmatimonadota bacterium]|nr:cupin domain-containing protein [Gemmatimonadota bacterium]
MSERPEQDLQDDRLRTAPLKRFEGPSHAFDLDAVAKQLRTEDHPVRHGHRQMTLFQRDHITHVVFVFDADGYLAEHSAPGLVTIHTHRGRIEVTERGEVHDLAEGQILVLDPKVPHEVRAREESVMLLTVHVHRDQR